MRNCTMIRNIIIVVVVSILIILFMTTITCVSAGHVGVANRFGKVYSEVMQPGMQLKPLFSRVIEFSTRTQETKEALKVPTSEGLIAGLEVSALYRINPDDAVRIYKETGANYEDVILIPGIRNTVRDVVAEYNAAALYDANRAAVATESEMRLRAFCEPYGVIVDRLLFRDVQLPTKLTESIELKMQAEQGAQAMEFVLQKERQEAERKRVEAQGIQDFQTIVSKGINENLLQWKGIEATEKLASSPNAKIVIVGGKDGLPLILNAQ